MRAAPFALTGAQPSGLLGSWESARARLNNLCGQNSARSAEICAIFQRDILPHTQPDGKSSGASNPSLVAFADQSGGVVDLSAEHASCMITAVVPDTHDADGGSRHDHSCSRHEYAGEICAAGFRSTLCRLGSKPVKLRTSKCFPVCPRKRTFDLRVNEYTEAACASTSARRAAVKREYYAP